MGATVVGNPAATVRTSSPGLIARSFSLLLVKALIANKFIEAINAKYGSNLKGPNVGNYRSLFPAVL